MKKWIFLVLMSLSAAALAEPVPDDSTPDMAATPGTQTRAWLDLQKSGRAAATGPSRPMPGEVADKVYQRYVDSFSHPIPESYPRDTASGSGSSGSSNGQGSGQTK